MWEVVRIPYTRLSCSQLAKNRRKKWSIVIPMNPKNTLRPFKYEAQTVCCEEVGLWKRLSMASLSCSFTPLFTCCYHTGVPWYVSIIWRLLHIIIDGAKKATAWPSREPDQKKEKKVRERESGPQIVTKQHWNHWHLWWPLPLAPPMTHPCVFRFDTLPRRILGDAGCT